MKAKIKGCVLISCCYLDNTKHGTTPTPLFLFLRPPPPPAIHLHIETDPTLFSILCWNLPFMRLKCIIHIKQTLSVIQWRRKRRRKKKQVKLYISLISDHIIVMCSTQVCNTDIQYSTKEEKKVRVAWGIGGGGVGESGGLEQSLWQ